MRRLAQEADKRFREKSAQKCGKVKPCLVKRRPNERVKYTVTPNLEAREPTRVHAVANAVFDQQLHQPLLAAHTLDSEEMAALFRLFIRWGSEREAHGEP